MKKFIIILLLFFACSKSFLKEGTVSPVFDLNRSYWVAPMPFLVRGPETTPDAFTRDRAYDYLTMQLQKTKRFYMKDKYTIQEELKKHSYLRVSGVEPSVAYKIGEKLGAEVVVLTDLSLEPEAGGLPVLAYIQILDVKTKAVMYSGRGGAINPASYEAAAEVAIDYALEALIKKIR